MLYYLPERIYNLVKDSDEFRLISEKVEFFIIIFHKKFIFKHYYVPMFNIININY